MKGTTRRMMRILKAAQPQGGTLIGSSSGPRSDSRSSRLRRCADTGPDLGLEDDPPQGAGRAAPAGRRDDLRSEHLLQPLAEPSRTFSGRPSAPIILGPAVRGIAAGISPSGREAGRRGTPSVLRGPARGSPGEFGPVPPDALARPPARWQGEPRRGMMSCDRAPGGGR